MNAIDDPRHAMRKLNLVGFGIIALLFGGVGGWAATAELAGAVIAMGTFVVESNIKKVQHPTGGIVGEILVKEGDAVTAGQVVMRLDDTLTRATLGVVRSQLDEATAREARLLTERDLADSITFPDHLASRTSDSQVVAALSGEQKLFESRRGTRDGKKAQFRERISQTNEELRGLASQLSGKESETSLIREELEGVADLYRKKLIPIIRYMQLQREQAKLQGDTGHLIAEMARARVKISETELQILQIDQDFRTDVLNDLRETQGKIAELKEKVAAAADQLKRVEIIAPQDGVVHQLSVHTIGGVIEGGETTMSIVPRADLLVVEATVAPQDIDQLSLRSRAIIRVMAGNQRTTPEISGTLTRISADLTRDPQSRQAYYVVRVGLEPEQLAKLGDFNLVPGMPAEVFIQTQSRTPLQYLLKPLREQIARTFKER